MDFPCKDGVSCGVGCGWLLLRAAVGCWFTAGCRLRLAVDFLAGSATRLAATVAAGYSAGSAVAG